jgi:hypothetical protein
MVIVCGGGVCGLASVRARSAVCGMKSVCYAYHVVI